MSQSEPHIKRCATVQSCNYKDRCKYSHTPLSGTVIFFVPQSTGENCDYYIPYMKPWGEGSVEDND